jgi:hypothetical protein
MTDWYVDFMKSILRERQTQLTLAEVVILGRDPRDFPNAWKRQPGDEAEIQRRRRIAWRLDPFTVFFDNPDYPDQPGTMRCCGRTVVQRNGALCCDICGAKHERADWEDSKAPDHQVRLPLADSNR